MTSIDRTGVHEQERRDTEEVVRKVSQPGIPNFAKL